MECRATSSVMRSGLLLIAGAFAAMAPVLAADGERRSGYLGVGFRLDPDSGMVAVEHVVPGSPSERQGVRAGDILESVGGADVRFSTHRQVLQFFAAMALEGRPMAMAYRRGDEVLRLQLTPVEKPGSLDQRNAARLRCLDREAQAVRLGESDRSVP